MGSILSPRLEIEDPAHNTTDHNGRGTDDRTSHNVGHGLQLL
jgi:hypothetical protein